MTDQSQLSDKSLRRFWFPSVKHSGIGVTAYSIQDATRLANEAASQFKWELTGSVIEDVDIRDLDQKHVVPNMGPPNFRGVWYPCKNL
jgi:hypothetical protein